MRTSLFCFLFLLGILVMEAKSISWRNDKTDIRDLEEALQDLKKTETTFDGSKKKDNIKETLKALTEEESDPASGNGEVNPEDY